MADGDKIVRWRVNHYIREVLSATLLRGQAPALLGNADAKAANQGRAGKSAAVRNTDSLAGKA